MNQVQGNKGGAVASCLVHVTLDQAVQVQALARDIVLCFWGRHFTLSELLSVQVYKWVPANLMLEGNPAMVWHPIQGGGGEGHLGGEGVEILSVASCYRYWR